MTAKFVRQAAAEFRDRKNHKLAKPAEKSKATSPNLRPAFKLIRDIEKLAGADGNQKLLAKVADLREYLQSIEE